MQCLVCKAVTDRGPTIAESLRPLCRLHWDGWVASGELARADGQGLKSKVAARAFMDWLNRVRAERRNAVPT